MENADRQFFAAWWNIFKDTPTNVNLLLASGAPDLITAAAVLAPPVAAYIGPVSPTKLGRWINQRATSEIQLDEEILILVKYPSTMPGAFWRLKLKEEMAEAAD